MNYLILFYDTLEEYKELTVEEKNGMMILKAHLEQNLSHQIIYCKQRATIRFVKIREANAKFFWAKATIMWISQKKKKATIMYKNNSHLYA